MGRLVCSFRPLAIDLGWFKNMAGQRVNLDRLPPKPEDALPDSTDPHGPCPRCGRQSNFSIEGSTPVTYDDRTSYELADGTTERGFDQQLTVLQCQGCRQNVIVIEEMYVGGQSKQLTGRLAGGAVQWRGIHWWPTPGMRPSDPDLPSAVADAVAEGTRCLAVKAPRAAAVMYRAALAQIVTDRGSAQAQAKKVLAAQLKQMAVDGDLDRTLADWADHIRVIGNAGAHPNELDPVSVEEAGDLARLINGMLEYLYVMPARIQRARAARP